MFNQKEGHQAATTPWDSSPTRTTVLQKTEVYNDLLNNLKEDRHREVPVHLVSQAAGILVHLKTEVHSDPMFNPKQDRHQEAMAFSDQLPVEVKINQTDRKEEEIDLPLP